MNSDTNVNEAESAINEAEFSRTELDILRADMTHQQELLIRTLADLDNVRKRTAREREEGRIAALTNLIEALLPVLDAFQMGLTAANARTEVADLVAGFKMAYDLMMRVLSEQGLVVINPLGQLLDPHNHECVAHQPSVDVAEDIVINVVRVGYKLGERLIRPASVIVASAAV